MRGYSYILNPEAKNSIVETVVDYSFLKCVVDNYSRTGSNMLMEYDDNGYTYVVFSMWGIMTYKIRICAKNYAENTNSLYTSYFYHVDGNSQKIVFGVLTDANGMHLFSKSPELALSDMAGLIKEKMSKLGERDLSVGYLNEKCSMLKNRIKKMSIGKMDISKFLDYESHDIVFPIIIFDQIKAYADKYDFQKSFYKNIEDMFENNQYYYISLDEKENYIKKYVELDKEGQFITFIENLISYYESLIQRINSGNG